jgi:hypothetical protein
MLEVLSKARRESSGEREEDAYGSSIEEPFYQFVLKIKNPSKC